MKKNEIPGVINPVYDLGDRIEIINTGHKGAITLASGRFIRAQLDNGLSWVGQTFGVRPLPAFLILSLKWTNKRDRWLTFWRPNAAGYAWFREWAGVYDEDEANRERDGDTMAINVYAVKKYWEKIEYEGKERQVLPNTKEVRAALGITLNDLKAKYITTH